MRFSFTIPGKPKFLQRHRTGKGGRYDPSKADKESFLAQCLQHRPDKPFDFPVKLVVRAIYGANPRTEVEISDLGDEGFYTKVPDGDNILKFVCDALQGHFFVDDKFIADARIIKLEEK